MAIRRALSQGVALLGLAPLKGAGLLRCAAARSISASSAVPYADVVVPSMGESIKEGSIAAVLKKRIECCVSPAGTSVDTTGRTEPAGAPAPPASDSSAAMDQRDTCGEGREEAKGPKKWWCLDVCAWIRQQDCPRDPTRAIVAAAEGGHQALGEWLLAKGPPGRRGVAAAAGQAARSPSEVAVSACVVPGTNTLLTKSPTACLKSRERSGGE
ncbi:hypothetical protein TSOC_000694 [Tetrabaena socialis]|uniref:Uncharacterized protein n=1 Tax=Tetrabaena socialis TaxID=47790 RepID=A0A2J8AIU6_9CHLO|nr:hypothetical protein TSOC_000694 [Tetrabaena socialis]|eukprot:PNH12439.1 hypothetical protein TSOC_000694 [Tetrabaena socialis]